MSCCRDNQNVLSRIQEQHAMMPFSELLARCEAEPRKETLVEGGITYDVTTWLDEPAEWSVKLHITVEGQNCSCPRGLRQSFFLCREEAYAGHEPETWFERIHLRRQTDRELASRIREAHRLGEVGDLDFNDFTVITWLIMEGSRFSAMALLDLRPEPDLDEDQDDTSLHVAAQRDDADLIRALLASGWARWLDRPNFPLGWSAVGVAVNEGSYHALEALIEAGAALDAEWFDDDDRPLRESALDMAVRRADLYCVARLMKAGADPDSYGFAGSTPMSAAERCEDPDMGEDMIRLMTRPD